jgi:pimeloyl-ACP methyl ester carboxylesterase
MKTFARDVYLCFYSDLGDAIRRRLREELAAAAGKQIAIVSHSLGTVIAYDVLMRSSAKVELLITMGSPLGLSPIRREIERAAFPTGLHRWLNAFDGTDPVTLPVQEIGNIYTRGGAHLVIDRMVRENHSSGGKRDAHHWFGYLTCQEVSDALSQFLIAP